MKPSDLIGTYTGSHFGGTEVISLKSDGTYEQSFTRSGFPTLRANGQWKLADDGIQFTNFLYLMDGETLSPRVVTHFDTTTFGKTFIQMGESSKYAVQR